MIAIGEWEPDGIDFDSTICPYVKNLRPIKNGWQPFPSHVVFSEALPSAPIGATMVAHKGVTQVYAGTADKLYRLNPTTKGWDEVGTGYSASWELPWHFLHFGNYLIAFTSSAPSM